MEEFADLYKKLHAQCSYYSRHLGHLKWLIANDDLVRVVDSSMSGRVLLLGNSEITNALVLFITRMLDTGSDTVSVHSLDKKLPSPEKIEEYHSDRAKTLGINYDADRYLLARNEFINAKRQLKKNTTIEKLRYLRNYNLAHYIEPEEEKDMPDLNNLLDLADAVNELVALAGYLFAKSRGVYRELSSRAEQETRMMYAALPALANVERE